jgi:hypothetical protein
MSGSAEERAACRPQTCLPRHPVGCGSELRPRHVEAMTWLHQRKAELVDLDLSGDQVLQQLDRLIG